MRFKVVLFASFLTFAIAAVPLSEKFAKRVATVEEAYTSATTKADNTKFFAIQKANIDRIKGLRAILSEATKAGEFDTLAELREKVAAAEKDGTVRPKPKNVVKFGGHEYALIVDQATWHVAKRRCEEMGGHLVCCESPQESEFVLALSGQESAWAGATDEETEGDWRWIVGNTKFNLPNQFNGDNGTAHHLIAFKKEWNDFIGGSRTNYICEWEK
ncbi:MAG: Clec4f, Clecsf13, Kclr [Planctomycetaceae bacterium]|nr:Clec4f, Clecsf13, Kclr [Planctomycetaceae bacterium]